MKNALLTYVAIALSFIVGYGYLFLSPEWLTEMSPEDTAAQWELFQVVYFSASCGLALVLAILITRLVKKPLRSLVLALIAFLLTQFTVDLFSGGEYEDSAMWLDHGVAILLAIYSVYMIYPIFIKPIKEKYDNGK